MDNVGENGWAGGATLWHGRIQIMLASPHYLPESVKIEGRHSQMLHYYYPKDLVAVHASLRDRGYRATNLVVRFYGMKEFEILDPSGHWLVLGQPTDEEPTVEK